MKKTISKLKKELDKWFSLYIRLKDATKDGMVICITSKRLYHYKNIHAGHFISRRHLATRWCEKNVAPQSAADNLFGQGEQYKFGIELDAKYGEGNLITDLPLILATKKKTRKVWPAHTVKLDHLEEFILFLRYCGGFEIY